MVLLCKSCSILTLFRLNTKKLILQPSPKTYLRRAIRKKCKKCTFENIAD